MFQAMNRHVGVDYYYVREKLVRGELDVCYISTLDQLADFLTEGLSTFSFRYLISTLLVCSFKKSLWGVTTIAQARG